MVDASKSPPHPAVTHLVDPYVHPAVAHVRNLVSHFEELGHRDNPVVLSAHEYLTSLEPKPEVKPPQPTPVAKPSPAVSHK